MSIIKINESLKSLHKRYSSAKKIPNQAVISLSNGIAKLEINGIPAIISIQYEGTGTFTSLMSLFYKVQISKNKIIINNLFRKPIPEEIFTYSGNINLIRCIIINGDGSKLDANITNNQNLDKINISNDTMLIQEQSKEYDIKTSYSGLSRKKIKSGTFNQFGKTQKYGKKEVEELSSIITDIAPSLIKSKNVAIKNKKMQIASDLELKKKELLIKEKRMSNKQMSEEEKKKLGGKY